MLPVIWLESALEDLARITQYIAERNPQAAQNLSQRLIEDAECLGSIPIYYRQGRVAGTHEYVSHPNYIIVYAAHWQVLMFWVYCTRGKSILSKLERQIGIWPAYLLLN